MFSFPPYVSSSQDRGELLRATARHDPVFEALQRHFYCKRGIIIVDELYSLKRCVLFKVVKLIQGLRAME